MAFAPTPVSHPSSLPHPTLPLKIHGHLRRGADWLGRFQGRSARFACVFGFTDTGLLPGISAAGATPDDRRYTALADAEFLHQGMTSPGRPCYPLPPLQAGLSPTLITRALWERHRWPCYLFNAGLPLPPSVPLIDLQGQPARCLSQGHALDKPLVQHLWHQGQRWGEILADGLGDGYVMLGECVVGGTTTALGILTGLGIAAAGRVNSSHATCNHDQKAAIVAQGLGRSGLCWGAAAPPVDPLDLVAAVGDPMQIVVAAMALVISRRGGVLLAGGTQMLAVYGLAVALADTYGQDWTPDNVVVGTTRWVVEDPTGDTLGLAQALGQRWGEGLMPSVVTTQLSFAESRCGGLRWYEQGFVKEGVGAGASAIAASLGSQWQQSQLLAEIEGFVDRYGHWRQGF
ncbi:nicotinate mononucleotide-dependent phosphoribosyltransferase CobT [Prochlorothrix hollandica]|uniref:UPF0284 protein PROH_07750 n=1 Tax=Prochlorothrix hollandica PCC 9006 = CALU 1027 TaxID=317619 RepID=A0A0M2PXD0_PROHO|nr:TIGR00303 family protein [Prochlorothrix hollandica]KKI99757.1 hypothetical protein PROH_07750 [Prochlorothrix hollandica PCC 9006 = CALU 1027]